MKFKVSFDGKWQGDFDDLDDALEYGREVANTGRLVAVARSTLFRTTLVGAFPEDRAETVRSLWRGREAGSTAGLGGN